MRAYSGPAASACRSFSRTLPDKYSSAVCQVLAGRIVVDQLAEFFDDRCFRLAVKLRDEGQVNAAFAVEGHQQPFLGAGDFGDRLVLAHHVARHDGGFFGGVGFLVVFLQGQYQNGVGIVAEYDDVGHAADDAAILGFRDGGLVDRAVGEHEAVVGAVKFAACFDAGFFRPALVLALQHAAGFVAQADQGGEALAGLAVIGGERFAAVDDRLGLAVHDLADDAVVVDEEAALGDVAFERRRGEGWGIGPLGLGLRDLPDALRSGVGRQPPDRFLELLGEVAVAGDGIAFAVQRVLAASSCPAPCPGGSGSIY